MQVGLHILKKLQDALLQNIKETFQGIKLFINQLRQNIQGETLECDFLYQLM